MVITILLKCCFKINSLYAVFPRKLRLKWKSGVKVKPTRGKDLAKNSVDGIAPKKVLVHLIQFGIKIDKVD